ncbi:MAG: response regulator transcription factor [Vulcanimicrobiaceae bacterium]
MRRAGQIMTLIAQGVCNAAIAERLFMGIGTVKGYIRNMMQKLTTHEVPSGSHQAHRGRGSACRGQRVWKIPNSVRNYSIYRLTERIIPSSTYVSTTP